MNDLLGILGALAVLVVPLLLAWLLLARDGRARPQRRGKAGHEKMPR